MSSRPPVVDIDALDLQNLEDLSPLQIKLQELGFTEIPMQKVLAYQAYVTEEWKKERHPFWHRHPWLLAITARVYDTAHIAKRNLRTIGWKRCSPTDERGFTGRPPEITQKINQAQKAGLTVSISWFDQDPFVFVSLRGYKDKKEACIAYWDAPLFETFSAW